MNSCDFINIVPNLPEAPVTEHGADLFALETNGIYHSRVGPVVRNLPALCMNQVLRQAILDRIQCLPQAHIGSVDKKRIN